MNVSIRASSSLAQQRPDDGHDALVTAQGGVKADVDDTYH